MPKVGAILSIWLPGGINRRGKILGYDNHDEMVLVRWVDYDLSDEWIPTRQL
jgi:hypothetical protein